MLAPFLAPYLNKFSAVVQIMHFFGAILASKFKENDAETASSKGAI